ncbi:thioredoxin family protein [Lactobacillus sp. LC28-10]|uniref:Thioredoxin family protein n=1 Tax=Secundilactobacillus angelensis TaxID=2722706 RepID=A0ABX1KUC7_9LACO|nr:thioredoxin family protein [Secundilactobacillus angelensis]MCH5461272.1 thioredoxin family protein [Secundilactobacillus angelensis]NLR17532.1 thioredoxin family protein [Secundilactobacillus angelensis]
MGSVKPIKDTAYAVETQDGLVLIDFRSDWCPPCTAVDRTLNYLATVTPFAQQVKFISLTVNQQPLIAQALGVQSTPTVILKKNGQIVDAVIGPRSATEFEILIKKYL